MPARKTRRNGHAPCSRGAPTAGKPIANGKHPVNGEHRSNGRAALRAASDQQVIHRCLAGEADAWSELYNRLHEPLMASIRGMYQAAVDDANLVEEIAARVWYALVKDDHKLLVRFDPGRGVKLRTYVSMIARSEARQYFRSERRRRRRETLVSRPDEIPSDEAHIDARELERRLLARLSPREHEFYEQSSAPPQEPPEPGPLSGISRNYRCQLRHRIRKKLKKLADDDGPAGSP